jgi:hypothetical protein
VNRWAEAIGSLDQQRGFHGIGALDRHVFASFEKEFEINFNIVLSSTLTMPRTATGSCAGSKGEPRGLFRSGRNGNFARYRRMITAEKGHLPRVFHCGAALLAGRDDDIEGVVACRYGMGDKIAVEPFNHVANVNLRRGRSKCHALDICGKGLCLSRWARTYKRARHRGHQCRPACDQGKWLPNAAFLPNVRRALGDPGRSQARSVSQPSSTLRRSAAATD